MKKKEARRLAKAFRKSIPADKKAELDAAVYDRLRRFICDISNSSESHRNQHQPVDADYEDAITLLTYVSYKNEVDTGRLIAECIGDSEKPSPFSSDGTVFDKKRLRIAVPRVNGDTMDFFYIDSFDDLESGCMGILEPKNYCVKYPALNTGKARDIIIMPGLAFTEKGKRCGYGGGYYDKYLSDRPKLLKLALCFSGQLLSDFEVEETDIYADYIITENEAIDCHARTETTR